MSKVKVAANITNHSHEISLSDGTETFGLQLEGGARGVQEIPQTPSTIVFSGGGTKFGDWEPGYSHLEQRTWDGGRGLDDFSLDATRFYDSMNAFTMLPNRAFPAPQWKFGDGIRETYEDLPGNVNWQHLYGSQRYLSQTFTVGGSDFAADNVEIWIRRIGSPGTLTVEIWSDSAGDPSAVVTSATATVTTSTITDFISQFYTFDLSAAGNLSASTAYHVVVYGASTDSKQNHWEIGVNNSASTAAKASTAGSSWAAASFGLYYRVSGPDINRKWHFFEMKGAIYATDQREDGTASSLFMLGERGIATGGAASTLTDSSKGIKGSWTDNEWNGWWIKITAGTGKGQYREITDTTTAGVITVSPNWDTNPSTDSDYVIYGKEIWQDITPASGDLIDGVVRDVAVFDTFAALAQGGSVLTLLLRYNSGAHNTDDAPNDNRAKVDLLHVAHDEVDGPQLWFARNNDMTLARMNSFTWGAPATTDFSSAISVGGDTWEMINMLDYNGSMYVFKVDGLYTISSDRATKENVGLGFIKSPNNGQAMCVHNTELYFSWGGYAVQRMIGRDIVSIGPDRGTGMPSGRTGPIVAMASHPAGIFACLDGGTSNTSSLLFFNHARQGWHEIFRGWQAGKRVQNVFWVDNPGTRPQLWMSVNGDLVYQQWPQGTLNPLEDSNMNFQHECYITLADMDMGVARLPKLFKEITLITENLTDGIEAHVEYQLDEDIGGANWTQIGSVLSSPEQSLDIVRGNKRKIRIRIRMLTNVATTAPVLRATVLEAFARSPVKYQWNMRVKTATNQRTKRRTPDHAPDELVTWLKNSARNADRLYMRSVWEQMDNKWVVAEPPTLLRDFFNAIRKTWKGSIVITIREA